MLTGTHQSMAMYGHTAKNQQHGILLLNWYFQCCGSHLQLMSKMSGTRSSITRRAVNMPENFLQSLYSHAFTADEILFDVAK